MRRKRDNDEFFIGMVGSSYTVNRKHRKRKKPVQKKILFRTLIITACVLVVAGIAALTWFVLIPFFSGLASATPDEATPDSASVDETVITTTVAETTVAQTTAAPTTVPETTVPETTAPAEKPAANGEHIAPEIDDDGSEAVMATNTICIWNNKAFNLFYSGNKAAEYYAESINSYANKLDKDIKVYNMVVGNHTEFGLPQRLIQGGITTDSQSDNINQIIAKLDKRITPVDCYNNLSEHCNEYIFYGTDHHWTALGAYYGYEAFCEAAGLTPMDISQSEVYSVDGFLGSLYTATGSSTLAANTDTVYYYSLPNETYAYMNESMSSDTLTVDVYYPAATAGELTYGVFCWGDTAKFVIHSDCNSGRKIALVKDSFANAFAPYLSANYDEVHLIDYRYWSGDLNKYCNDNGITEVLFLNNTMSANTVSQVDSISNVFG